MGLLMRDLINEKYIMDFGISPEIVELCGKAEDALSEQFREVERIREFNQLKVIKAMQKNKLSDSHFAGSTGYGYGDRGREVLDSVFADVFGAEDAIVRSQIVSGTHALMVAMAGNLRPEDGLVSITGKPYDTLEEAIGIRGEATGSLKEFGINYRQHELTVDGNIDIEGLNNVITADTKMCLIQRSRGYAWREAIGIDQIRDAIIAVKKIKEDVIILVDNCYGEFVEEYEPTEVGADLIAGSLIKNPGGGLALSGGYIAGKKEYVKMAAYRLTSPGIGKEVGATLGQNRSFFQGLFFAPHVVGESLKGAMFCAKIMEMMGFECSPSSESKRKDIIQAIRFGDKEKLIDFCQGIQKGSPVDSFVTPYPWDMPGYDCEVIMAAGAFVQGASIELSADAPIKEPYIAYMQGGLVYENVKLGVMTALTQIAKK